MTLELAEEKAVSEVDPQELMGLATGFKPEGEGAEFLSDIIGTLVRNATTVPPWWSRQRDVALRSAWKDGNYASSMMFLAQTKLATIPMVVEARDKSIASHVRQASNITKQFQYSSGFGMGWYETMMKFTEDYLGQDNGGFMEIIGDGPSDGQIVGAPAGVRHLDSSRCTRTGHPVYPVVYIGDDSQRYKMHFSRVFVMSQMPSSMEKMHGVGYCSVSRSLRILQNLLHFVNYKDEKMGARAAHQILVGSGLTGKEIIKAIAAAEAMMTSLGLEHYNRTIALGSTDGSVDLKHVSLNDMADFDEASSYTFAAYALALAWGLEFQEVIPVSGSKVAEIISLQRSRAKLPHLYTTAFMQQANLKLVPPHLELVLDYQDDQADQQSAVIEDITSRNFERQMNSNVTTPEVVQSILYDRGYLSREQLRSMQLSRGMLQDGSPVQSLFYNANYMDFLLIDRKFMAVRQQDEMDAFDAIEENRLHIYDILGNTRASETIHRGLESLAALDWLEEEYLGYVETEPVEEPAEEPAEDQELEPTIERRGVGEGGEEEKAIRPATNWFIKNNAIVWEGYR